MEYEKRYCLVCEKELIKRPYVSMKRYSEKKYCGNEHARKHMKENKLGWWREDSYQGN